MLAHFCSEEAPPFLAVAEKTGAYPYELPYYTFTSAILAKQRLYSYTTKHKRKPIIMDQEPQAPNTDEQPSAPPPPTQPIKTEDELFQSAGQHMEMESSPEVAPNPVVAPKKSKKKPIIAVIVLVIVLAGAGVVGYLLTQDRPSESPTVTTQPTETKPAALTYEPNTVTYTYRAKSSDPVAVFTRPAAGGERKEIQQLTRDSVITASDTSGPNSAFVDGNTIYVSTDNGETYKKVFEGEAGAQVTSLKFDADNTGLAFGYLKSDKPKNEVRTIDMSGQNAKTLFTADTAGAYILGWSSKAERMIYQTGCYNCDGRPENTYSFDTKSTKRTALLEDVQANELASISVSSDTSLMIYIVGVYPTNSDDPLPALVPPYVVNLMKLGGTDKPTEIARIGNAGEKNSNGTLLTRTTLTGFTAGTNTPYYTADKQLFLVKANEGLLFYESADVIENVDYISDKYVISRTGDPSDFTMANYDTATKKSVTILQGDNNTTIFGITTD